MQLNLEHPDHEFLLRGADGRIAVVNDRQLNSSFILAPDRLGRGMARSRIHAP
jgi:hypothetical protein